MGVSLQTLIPPLHTMVRYFRYNGSLTTPSCDEAVVWSLFESAIPLGRKQVSCLSPVQKRTVGIITFRVAILHTEHVGDEAFNIELWRSAGSADGL